ncbi:hypothetical protein ENSA7_64960 [Enhygromyxa salina]|uniref:Uncharacterized protein n=1 Tax=Enhygromyxa salina TaxID=215803 RepID=A0A2S9Y0C6_9BACT|nr:hypothetical protein ENSA7_64960 [Enhygromyxa salina]
MSDSQPDDEECIFSATRDSSHCNRLVVAVVREA